jgi:hypothetical protein
VALGDEVELGAESAANRGGEEGRTVRTALGPADHDLSGAFGVALAEAGYEWG